MNDAGERGMARAQDRTAVLRALARAETMTVAELSAALKLGEPVTRDAVAVLTRRRWIAANDEEIRASSPVWLNRAGLLVASVDMGGTKIYGTLNDLAGKIYAEQSLATHGGSADSLSRLAELIRHLTAQPHAGTLLGVGIGVPGVTTHDGVVALSPQLGWTDMPVKQRLTAQFDLPVFVENDVNLAALGEYGYGVARRASSLVCIALGTGIGGGIVLDGRLWRGFHASAGEVGYMLPGLNFLHRRYEGYGAFESMASGTGIAARARARLGEMGENGGADMTAHDVFAAAKAGMAWAAGVLDETVDVLTHALANITAVLDPEAVVLSGGVMASAGDFAARIEDNLRAMLPFYPRIVVSNLGPRATTLGATMLVMNGLMEAG